MIRIFVEQWFFTSDNCVFSLACYRKKGFLFAAKKVFYLPQKRFFSCHFS